MVTQQEVNEGIQQRACPRRVESASSYSFTSSYFSCNGYNLTVPHTFKTGSLANVQEGSNCLDANQGNTLPMPGSSAGVEALSSYMERLRLGGAAFNDQSFVDYSPAKADNPYQFRQAAFHNYIPTQGFPEVHSQQYVTQPCVRASPEIARATNSYDTRWMYRDSTADQTRHKPLIRGATKRSSKKMHPSTGTAFKPSNIVKKPRVLRSRCRGESSSSSSNTNFRRIAQIQAVEIQCKHYGCGRVFSGADACKRHMLFCPFRK